jgi:hypothetical protein
MSATTAEAPSLAERLAKAREAEASPRQRVAEIETALRDAEARRDFAEADRLERELQPAREALGFASGLVTALSGQAAAIEADRLERERARQLAEQRAGAQQVVAQALEAERRADSEGRQHLARVFELIEAAKAEFRAAVACEEAVGRARRVVAEQRVLTGELAAAPGRGSLAPNFASVLPQNDRFIQSLLAYAGPAQSTPRPVISSTAPPAGARAATQASPWPGGAGR